MVHQSSSRSYIGWQWQSLINYFRCSQWPDLGGPQGFLEEHDYEFMGTSWNRAKYELMSAHWERSAFVVRLFWKLVERVPYEMYASDFIKYSLPHHHGIPDFLFLTIIWFCNWSYLNFLIHEQIKLLISRLPAEALSFLQQYITTAGVTIV